MTLFIILSLIAVLDSNSNIIVERYKETSKIVLEEESDMYLVWQDGDSRDSTFQGEFSWNEYDKTDRIKSLQGVQELSRYTEDDKDEFRFLFADPSRFKGHKNKVSAIVFQGTPTQKKLLDEIRYITLDDRFNVNASAGIMPVYEGGYQGMIDYFNKKLNATKNHDDSGFIPGDVLVGFVVDEEGKVDCAKILESSNEKLDKQAYDLVKSMPAWKPARNGYPVPVFLAIQLIFFTD